MQPRLMPRFGDGLRAIGVLLVLVSVAVLGFATLTVFMAVGSTQDGTANTQRHHTVNLLLELRDIPRAAIDEFERTGTMDRAALRQLSEGERRQAERLLEAHDRVVNNQATPGTVLGVGGCGLFVLGLVFVPLLIGGALLLRRRSVWWCQMCGYVFDRA